MAVTGPVYQRGSISEAYCQWARSRWANHSNVHVDGIESKRKLYHLAHTALSPQDWSINKRLFTTCHWSQWYVTVVSLIRRFWFYVSASQQVTYRFFLKEVINRLTVKRTRGKGGREGRRHGRDADVGRARWRFEWNGVVLGPAARQAVDGPVPANRQGGRQNGTVSGPGPQWSYQMGQAPVPRAHQRHHLHRASLSRACLTLELSCSSIFVWTFSTEKKTPISSLSLKKNG